MKVINTEQLLTAVEALQNGQTIVFPTETSYGLGCDAANQDAVNKIFKIKGRQSDKPLLVVMPTVEMAKKYLVWNDLLEDLSKKYWPGPLTVVGEYLSLRGALSDEAIPKFGSASEGIAALPAVARNDSLAFGVVSPSNTIAVRVTNHPVLKFLSEKLGRPVVATSANLAGAGDIYDSKKIIEKPSFATSIGGAMPDILIDGGVLPQNPPTTIVSVVENNIKILRQGQIKIN